jgi:hypothetical protein
MDDLVKAAMAKWPNVPDCYGWLALDARGDWYMRDEVAQAQGSKGSRLQHDKLIAFIGRNYSADEHGRWYFQNGPQRVYVELEDTPWVWRLMTDGSVQTHTGEQVRIEQAGCDERGRLYLVSERGWGLVHTADMNAAAQRVESGEWALRTWASADLPQLGGFVRSPQAQEQAKKKPV